MNSSRHSQVSCAIFSLTITIKLLKFVLGKEPCVTICINPLSWTVPGEQEGLRSGRQSYCVLSGWFREAKS